MHACKQTIHASLQNAASARQSWGDRGIGGGGGGGGGRGGAGGGGGGRLEEGWVKARQQPFNVAGMNTFF